MDRPAPKKGSEECVANPRLNDWFMGRIYLILCRACHPFDDGRVKSLSFFLSSYISHTRFSLFPSRLLSTDIFLIFRLSLRERLAVSGTFQALKRKQSNIASDKLTGTNWIHQDEEDKRIKSIYFESFINPFLLILFSNIYTLIPSSLSLSLSLSLSIYLSIYLSVNIFLSLSFFPLHLVIFLFITLLPFL
ncbi:unnamed protein product [Acanthosepion pharaonis]|uniref:Uncharacterized protein n=1 Tax=Acanthosepion pharaonis TaxID=158019 RepID=A0A812DFA2_ACAPH|nr:unnamed protein product [Sepia pharaonis]